AIDGERARAQRQRVGDRRAEADPMPRGLGAAEIAGADLLDEQAGDLAVGSVQPSAVVDNEAVEEPADDVGGVGQVEVGRRGRRDPRPPPPGPWRGPVVGRHQARQADRHPGRAEELTPRRGWTQRVSPGIGPAHLSLSFDSFWSFGTMYIWQ